MSNSKSIELNLGGRFNFKVVKALPEDNERFTVVVGTPYGSNVVIADFLTWAEASSAMNKFRDEFDDAFEALVQISTLTPVGVHEES